MKWTIAWSIRLAFTAAVAAVAIVAALSSRPPAAPHVWHAHLLPAVMTGRLPQPAKTGK
jgi:hypothetical protein